MKTCLLFSALLISFFFCSCESTRVYVKSQSLFYDDNKLVEESGAVTRIDYKDKSAKQIKKQKDVENYTRHFYDFSDEYNFVEGETNNSIHSFTVNKDQSSKKKYDIITFTLIETPDTSSAEKKESYVLGQRKVKFKKGKASKPVKTGKFTEEDEALYQKISTELFSRLNTQKDSDKASDISGSSTSAGKMRTENCTERITVESKTNGKYVAYTFLGKPFVLIGASVWNVIKCGGYAVINFFGGYSFVMGSNDPFWLMPSYGEAKQDAEIAREVNRIKYYPEYHIPFTNNHITVDKFNREIEVEKLFSEGAEEITAVEHYEYDNTMAVSLSAKADAASTAATAGLVGTVITIPVSGASWVFGAIAGIAQSLE